MTQQKTRATTLQQKFGFQDADLTTPAHDALMVWLDQNVEKYLLGRYQVTEWPTDLVQKYLSEMKDRVKTLTEKWEGVAQNYRNSQDWMGKRSYDQAVSALAQCRSWELPKATIYAAIDCGNGRWHSEEIDFLTRVRIAQKVWEQPIMTGKEFMVGFVDMMIQVDCFGDLSYSQHDDKDKLPGQWICMGKKENYLFEIKPMIPSVGELIRQIRMYQQYKAGTYIVVSPDDRFASVLAGQDIGFLKAPSL